MLEKALASLNMLRTWNIEQILTFHKHFRMIKYSAIYVFIMHQLKCLQQQYQNKVIGMPLQKQWLRYWYLIGLYPLSCFEPGLYRKIILHSFLFLKQVNYIWNNFTNVSFFLPTMALQTKCSEFTGKKVVSQDEIFFWKSGIKKENISNWYAIQLPWNYHWIIYTMFM